MALQATVQADPSLDAVWHSSRVSWVLPNCISPSEEAAGETEKWIGKLVEERERRATLKDGAVSHHHL